MLEADLAVLPGLLPLALLLPPPAPPPPRALMAASRPPLGSAPEAFSSPSSSLALVLALPFLTSACLGLAAFASLSLSAAASSSSSPPSSPPPPPVSAHADRAGGLLPPVAGVAPSTSPSSEDSDPPWPAESLSLLLLLLELELLLSLLLLSLSSPPPSSELRRLLAALSLRFLAIMACRVVSKVCGSGRQASKTEET